MTSRFLRTLLLLSFTLLLALPQARAQSKGDISFGPGLLEADLSGFGFHVWPRFYVGGSRFQIGLNTGAYFDSESASFFGTTISASTTVIPLVVTGTYNVSGRKAQPFFGAGLGATVLNASLEINGQDAGSGSTTNFTTNLHAGVNINLSEAWFFHLRTGVDFLFAEGITLTGVPLLLGAGVRF